LEESFFTFLHSTGVVTKKFIMIKKAVILQLEKRKNFSGKDGYLPLF
jgi:hypothetical protein